MTRPFVILAFTCLAASCANTPPRSQADLCAVFDQYPEWYDYARASQQSWGTPIPVLMAFVKQESSYRHNAKPPRDWFLFIPLKRKSSAKGYGQIQDPAWHDYKKETGGLFKSRSDLEDALDFIGWYNNISNKRLGIAKNNARALYLAYHEGHTGYQRRTYRKKPQVMATADRVQRVAQSYGAQLGQCEDRFRCRKWYQFWPFCQG